MNIRALLHNSTLFAGATEADLDLLTRIGRGRQVQRGELLFSEGEPALGFYLVGSGKVKIYKLSPEGKERILHIVHPGWSFAEAAIFGDGRYPAYAEPLEPSFIVFFPREEFLQLLHNHSGIAINIIGGLSRFLRQFAQQVEELTFKDVPARLARYLLELDPGGKGEVTLPIAKSQLASKLGTVSETLSRTLRKLSDEGVIAVQGKRIVLQDADRLEELAQSWRER